MPRFIQAGEATAARRRLFWQLVGTDGITPATGEAGGQPQVSIDGGAWAGSGSIGTLTAIGNGRYYADLAAASVATAGVRIESRYKSASTAECPGDSADVVSFDPYEAIAEILEDTGTTLPVQIVGVSCDLTAQEIWEYTTRTLTSDSVVASSASLAVTWEPDLLMMGDDIPHSLSYYRRTGKDTYAAVVTITSVIREDIAAGALDSAGAVLPRGSVAYHFQSLQVSYTPPAPFDRVVEGSAAYTIHEISNLDDGKRYKIVCKPER